MQEIVRNFLKKYNIKNENVLVGFSSGVDSAVLLDILSNLKDEFSLRITALHLNHNWRGEQSDDDERFAKDFCTKRNIAFFSEKLPIDIQKTETVARNKRYEFFENCANKFNAKRVFLAHNKNDNAETLLYRIVKGTGIDGMRAIPENRDIFYRPLLEISKSEIVQYARKHNIKHTNDASNIDIKYNRNFIRCKILPLLEEINPTMLNSVSNLIKVANYEYEIIRDKMNEIEQNVFKDDKIQTQIFLKLKTSYQIKILQTYIKDDLKNPNLNKIEQILEFIKDTTSETQDPQWRKHKRFSINSHLFLYVNKNEIFKGK